MARNVAARRAAKAQRRKVIVAQKRRMEVDTTSIGGRVRAAAADPIQHCLVSRGLFTTGMGILVLARGPSAPSVTAAAFLLDTFGLGVKEAFIRSFGGHEFDDFVGLISESTPLETIEPDCARKLLHDLVAWSRDLGFNPHPDYAKIEPVFGSVDAAASGATYDFGHEGKPLIIGEIGSISRRWARGNERLIIDAGDGDFGNGVGQAAIPEAIIAGPQEPGRDDERAAA